MASPDPKRRSDAAFDPQAIKESLEVHWPAGRYDIREGHATGSRHGGAGRRWGAAIKRADGAATLAAEADPDR